VDQKTYLLIKLEINLGVSQTDYIPKHGSHRKSEDAAMTRMTLWELTKQHNKQAKQQRIKLQLIQARRGVGGQLSLTTIRAWRRQTA
jgi:hypothetical protein